MNTDKNTDFDAILAEERKASLAALEAEDAKRSAEWRAGAAEREDALYTAAHGWVHDYATGAEIRPATAEELAASILQAKSDGGAGVISDADGRSVYVQE